MTKVNAYNFRTESQKYRIEKTCINKNPIWHNKFLTAHQSGVMASQTLMQIFITPEVGSIIQIYVNKKPFAFIISPFGTRTNSTACQYSLTVLKSEKKIMAMFIISGKEATKISSNNRQAHWESYS